MTGLHGVKTTHLPGCIELWVAGGETLTDPAEVNLSTVTCSLCRMCLNDGIDLSRWPAPCFRCGWQYDETRLRAAIDGRMTLDPTPTHMCVPGEPEPVTVADDLAKVARLVEQAQAALADEHEGDLRRSITSMNVLVQRLHHTVTTW